MKHLRLVMFSAALGGCTGVAGLMGAHVNAYEGPERPDTEVATIFTPRAESMFARSASRAYVTTVDGQTYGSETRGYPQIVKVLPGRHEIGTRCFVPGKYALPAIRMTFQAGRYYELGCSDLGDGTAASNLTDRGAENPLKK